MPPPGGDLPAEKAAQIEQLAAGMPANPTKPAEHGFANGVAPQRGATVQPASRLPTASTLSEENMSDKVGSVATEGGNATIEPLDRVRVDSSGQALTTNQGVRDRRQPELAEGTALRGPALLEDFILREKITHFDHERIPERIVHARGSGAHGFFECYEALTDITKAAPFQRGRQASRRCSCASPPWRASAAPRTPRATCAASRSSSTPTKATGTWWATTCRCSSSRTR